MNNLEENLRKIKTKRISDENKEHLWHSIMTRRAQMSMNQNKLLSINIFNFSMKNIFVGVLALLIIFGGGGVVAASNDALPGDFLFPVDMAIESLRIKFSDGEKKSELRFRFAEERVAEIKEISEKKSLPASSLITDLSGASILQVEADVFTNETVVKIEANNKNYGYTSKLRTKEALVKEISEKYSISEEKVSEVLDFEIEDRESRADDKGFLNKIRSVNFSPRESEDVSEALTEVEKFLNESINNENKDELRKSLQEILILLGDDAQLEIRKDDNKIKIENKNGELKIEVKNSNSGKSKNDKDDNSEDDSRSNDDDLDQSKDIREDDSEVFCRGEWRDQEDCDDSKGSDDTEDDLNDSSDDNDNISDDKNDDSDDSGKDESDDEEDEDNSGSGKDDDSSGSGGGDDN